MHRTKGLIGLLSIATLLAVPGVASAQEPGMSFFVTSRGPGDGANLGGLAGADAHCQMLAAAAGAGDRTWRAYLSQTEGFGQDAPVAINARDRIGAGPWYNANGEMIAASVADLHGDIQRDRNAIRKPTALDENGNQIPGVGDDTNQHDILTGSDSRGYALIGVNPAVTTCNNWTSNGAGNAMVGHHDRQGGPNTSWNAAHFTIGCSQENLVQTGGNGYFYCFAAD